MRKTTIVALTLLAGLVPALPAMGQDLEEWLDRASRAEYEGRQFTICDTPDGTRVEVVEVAQRDGLLEVRAAAGRAVVSPDGVYERSADGSVTVRDAETASDWELAERYRVEYGDPDAVLNRPVDVLRVMENDAPRVELSFDRETGAVLQAEVFNSDASRYCTSSFLHFEAGTDEIRRPAMIAEVIQPSAVADDRLPAELAGFVRKDAYEGPGGSSTGFYSDGIFSFTLVTADLRLNVHGVPETNAAAVGASVYDRAFTAGQSYHAWETPTGGYVMLGDLPLDLQQAVLEELPAPGKPNFFARFWRKFFG